MLLLAVRKRADYLRKPRWYCREKLAPRVSQSSPAYPLPPQAVMVPRTVPLAGLGLSPRHPPPHHSTEPPTTTSFHLPELNSSGRAPKAAAPQATCFLSPSPLLTPPWRALDRCHQPLWGTVLGCGWPWLFTGRRRVLTQGGGNSAPNMAACQLSPPSPRPASSPELRPHRRATWVPGICLLAWPCGAPGLGEQWRGHVLPQPSFLTAATRHPALLVVLWVADQQVGAGCSHQVTAAVFFE